MIDVQIGENGEIQMFQINSQVAKIMFIKDLNEECNIRGKSSNNSLSK